VYVVSCASGPTLWVPLTASAPLHPPEAVQLVTLVPAQVSVVEPFLLTPTGFADNVTAGVPAVTVTFAVCETFPPGPAQASVKLELAVSAPLLCVPEVPRAPVQEPDAVQLVAFVVLHVSCEALPDCTLEGDALNVSVGAAADSVTAAVCEPEPPAPVHVSV